MYYFLLHIFMFQLSSALTPRVHTNPSSTTNSSLDLFEASEVHYSPRYIFVIDCIETRGVVGNLPQTLWKVGRWWRTYFIFYGKHFISNWILSIREKHVKLTRDLKPVVFVCLFVLFCFFIIFYFACQFLKFLPSCAHQKLPLHPSPTFRSISKTLYSPL
jgi:hypothetical protein